VSFWRTDMTGRSVRQVARGLQQRPDGAALPAVVAAGALGTSSAPGLDGKPVALQPVASSPFIPRYGPKAVLVDLDGLLERVTGRVSSVRAEVWLAPDAGPVEQRLRAAGLRVVGGEDAVDRQDRFARQAPSLALLLFLAGAGIAALLALGGTVLDLYLLGRRRAFEIAAMAAVGVRRRVLVASVLTEQSLLLGSGVLVGVAAGLAAVGLTLPSVPEYTDDPAFPALLLRPDPLLVAGLLGVAVVLLAGAISGSAALLVRSAVPSRLREAQP